MDDLDWRSRVCHTGKKMMQSEELWLYNLGLGLVALYMLGLDIGRFVYICHIYLVYRVFRDMYILCIYLFTHIEYTLYISISKHSN